MGRLLGRLLGKLLGRFLGRLMQAFGFGVVQALGRDLISPCVFLCACVVRGVRGRSGPCVDSCILLIILLFISFLSLLLNLLSVHICDLLADYDVKVMTYLQPVLVPCECALLATFSYWVHVFIQFVNLRWIAVVFDGFISCHAVPVVKRAHSRVKPAEYDAPHVFGL